MALSVRMAMLICLGSIGGMSWVVQQFSAPRPDVAAAEVTLAPAQLASVVGLSGMPQSGGLGRQRGEWARQFSRPNTLEAQAEANRMRRDTLACVPPTSPPTEEAQTASLPPLAYDADLVIASAPPLDGAFTAPAGEEPVVVAAGDGAATSLEPAQVAKPTRYRVNKGDTLTRIAQQTWKSTDRRLIELLTAANPQVRQRRGRILVGEELIIPDTAEVQGVLAGAKNVPAAEPVAVAAGREAAPKTGELQWYTIQRNDSLASIAQRFLKDGRRWREIAALNSGLDPHKIVPGLRIKLPPVIRMAHG